jgi:hypothetical protein
VEEVKCEIRGEKRREREEKKRGGSPDGIAQEDVMLRTSGV